MTNMDKLYASVAANGPVCVGLDTEFSYLPADVVDYTKTAGENVVEFNRRIIEATKASAGCYKVQIAYYESLGLDGMRAYAETLKMVRATGLPVIADIKRGDIAKTAEMYAKAHFTGDFEADIITLAPYMGLDSISPYLPYCKEQGKGLFVLCRTSNPGAKDFEYKKLEDGRHVYDLVGDSLSELGRDYIGESGYSSIGLVIGHLSGALAIPALFNTGAGDEALEAAVVEGAGAVLANGVARVARDQDVTGLGVHHAVHKLAAREHTGAHAGADGQVDHIGEALSATKSDLAQAGDVDVGIVAAGDIELVLDAAQQVKVAPCRLWGL